jgi:hypothetical protein
VAAVGSKPPRREPKPGNRVESSHASCWEVALLWSDVAKKWRCGACSLVNRFQLGQYAERQMQLKKMEEATMHTREQLLSALLPTVLLRRTTNFR